MAKAKCWWIGRYGRVSTWRLFSEKPGRPPAGSWSDRDGCYGLDVPDNMVPAGIVPDAGIDDPVAVEPPARLVLRDVVDWQTLPKEKNN